MIWFNGSIETAVDKVKSTSSFLLVFVQGDDEISRKYEKIFDEEVQFKSEDVVPIKITHNSVAYEQFKKIYGKVPVPSVFLTGTNGIPIAIVCSLDPSNLNNIIIEAISKYKKQNGTHTENKFDKINKTSTKDIRHCALIEEDKRKRCETVRICPSFLLYDSNPSCERVRSSQIFQSARIQFRLPSNEARSWEFPNTCTLSDVKIYLMETMKLKQGFKLLRTFPRTTFTAQDEDKTLIDLSLTPTATLIVVPTQDDGLQSKIKNILTRNTFISSLVSAIFQPVFTLFGFLGKFFQKATVSKKVNQIRKVYPESKQKRFSKKTNSNVHGFEFDESDTDSDMNTDNGNSTQQK